MNKIFLSLKSKLQPILANRKIKITVFVVFLTLTVIYIVVSAMSPYVKGLQIEKELNELELSGQKNISVDLLTPVTDSLLRLKAFKESNLELAKSDSIGLIINLKDSLCILSVKGVPVFNSKISKFNFDKLLKNLDINTYLGLFSHPLTCTNVYSTIVKEPIIEKQAPKDTSEVPDEIEIPDTLKKPTFVSFDLPDDIGLIIAQDESKTFMDKKTYTGFYSRQNFRLFLHNLNSMIHLKIPPYQLMITVNIPRDDTFIVYRAIPYQPQIVIYYEQ